MQIQRSLLSSFLLLTALVFFNTPITYAQTDAELFERYLEKPEADLSSLQRLTVRISESDYLNVSLSSNAEQTLKELIKDHHQAKVLSVFFVAHDTSEVTKVFTLLQQFPNLEFLNFYDDGQSMIKSSYRLPEEILKLNKLKVVSINGAPNLDMHDMFDKLNKMSALRGVDLLNYKPPIPLNSVLPGQITMVKLSTPQLLNLDTKKAKWRMAKIEQRGNGDPKDERLLEKLAALNSLEVLDFQFCFINSGAVFKKFTNLHNLKINPVLAKDAEFVKSLSTLTQLKGLTIYEVSDTSQSFSDLGKLHNLEYLELNWVSRFKNHPEELMSIAKLTKLRSLVMKSCHLSACPDFFKPLTNLESVILKWNKENWNQNTSFSLPSSLYQLPELKTLTIWKTISDLPSLNKLTKLQLLDLNYNNITHIEGLTELKYLKTVYLKGNQLKDVQALDWAKITSLENLDLSKNQITAFPNGLQRLHELKFLDLSANQITSYPPLDDANYQLKILVIDHNHVKGLPSNIHRYKELQLLSAVNCDLTTLPDSIGNLKQLRELNLEANNLKTLPAGLAKNLNLHDINLRNNGELEEQSIYRVVFGNAKKRFLRANLDNTGLDSLPVNAPWMELELVLDLSNNHLMTLPVEMLKMKWFDIKLKNNPFKVDAAFINRGITSPADAKVLFQELSNRPNGLKITNIELAVSMTGAIRELSFNDSFEKAVEYATKAKALDSLSFDENVDWFAIGKARFKTNDYKNAITDLNTYLARSIYKTWWSSRMAKETEAALAESYEKLGNKRKAAETHAFFADKVHRAESSLSAALSYLELGEPTLSKKYFDSAIEKSEQEYLKYPDIVIFNYAEILLMAEKPDKVLNMFKAEDAKVLNFRPAYVDYLETVALLMKHPDQYKKLKSEYVGKIEKNGKVTDWDYSNFNRWIKYSGRPDHEKQQLYELEALND